MNTHFYRNRDLRWRIPKAISVRRPNWRKTDVLSFFAISRSFAYYPFAYAPLLSSRDGIGRRTETDISQSTSPIFGAYFPNDLAIFPTCTNRFCSRSYRFDRGDRTAPTTVVYRRSSLCDIVSSLLRENDFSSSTPRRRYDFALGANIAASIDCRSAPKVGSPFRRRSVYALI